MSSASARVGAGALAPVFAALGDRTRLALLARLSDGRPRSISELTGHVRLTRQAVTKHLRVLQAAGVVSSVRVGRESRFAYRGAAIGQARAYLDKVAAQWDAALMRLRALVEA
jgi:DNA-binding transcriptional ArsR family regulator